MLTMTISIKPNQKPKFALNIQNYKKDHIQSFVKAYALALILYLYKALDLILYLYKALDLFLCLYNALDLFLCLYNALDLFL